MDKDITCGQVEDCIREACAFVKEVTLFDVYEGKQNFYCSNRQCDFALWKENRFLGSMEKTLDKKMAVELLDKACTHVKGLYSRKKDIKFDADLLLTLEDGKPRFHLEFPKKKKK